MINRTFARSFIFIAAMLSLTVAGWAQSSVAISETDATYTLDNGIISALVSKKSGDLISMKYNGVEMLATIMGKDGQPDLVTDPPGANVRGFAPFTDHQYGFWSHDATSPHSVTK